MTFCTSDRSIPKAPPFETEPPDDEPLRLGLDLGSVNLRAVLVSGPSAEGDRVLRSVSTPVSGRLRHAVDELLGQLAPAARFRVGVTGVARALLSGELQVSKRNEIITLAEGVRLLAPAARSVIEVGGQTSRWVQLSSSGEVEDFALGEQCAAGCGAFIEQQAGRLQLSLAQLSAAAASAARGAPVAGRCSVFAKSDMIHLQQKGIAVDEIALGLCRAVSRSLVASLLRGRRATGPVALAGGGAENRGLARALAEALGVQELLVPPLAGFVSAVGAARLIEPSQPVLTVDELRRALGLARAAGGLPSTLAPLERPTPRSEIASAAASAPRPAGQRVPGYLGVDVGSVSTNLVVLDPDGAVEEGIYLATRGRPLEVIREGLGLLRQRYEAGLEVLGVGTTGSGRHLAAALLGADVVQNEITCQLRSALHFFDEVDSIIEIGGQDSKFISIRNRSLADFAMNKICAAGTGSFLEEESARLCISVEEDFAALALSAPAPLELSCRCTVFMDTEVVNAQARRVPLADLCAGLAYAVARNYLERVVERRPVGEHVVMQGGVACNAAVVAALARLLGRVPRVHPHARISGAIGAALLARERQTQAATGRRPSEFRGLASCDQRATVRTRECAGCSSRCQVSEVELGGLKAHFGDACERLSARDHRHARADLPDLLVERERMIRGTLPVPEKPRGVVGLPWASYLHEQLPFWATLLGELGFAVRLSSPSSAGTLERGAAHLPAETCLPIKLAFGHVQELVALGVDAVLVPSLSSATDWEGESSSSCPYVQSLPFMLAAALDGPLLTPELHLGDAQASVDRLAAEIADGLGTLRVHPAGVSRALPAALAMQRGTRQRLRARGAEVLEQYLPGGRPLEGGPACLLLLGKPYNLGDPFLNLSLGKHLRRLGALALPLDLLPARPSSRLEGSRPAELASIPWRYSREIVRAALDARRWPGLHPVLVSSYGCGPDAFTSKQLLRLWREAPHLELEFDEHRAEAGLITRLEAFLDEVAHRPVSASPAPPLPSVGANRRAKYRGRRVFIPYFADHAYAMAGALQGSGLDARLLPPAGSALVSRSERCASGRECHAYAMLAADLDQLIDEHRRGDVYLVPGSIIPCLIQQYPYAMVALLEQRGARGLELLSPNMTAYRELLGYRGALRLYQGLLAIDLLVRATCSLRPYELQPGAADRQHALSLQDIQRGLADGGLDEAVARCADRLNQIAVDRRRPRPLVGVAGDIYTRVHPVANARLFWRLEELGCEVWPAPFLVDIARYGVQGRIGRSLRTRQARLFAESSLMTLLLRAASWQVESWLRGPRWDEPSLSQSLSLAAPYVGRANMDLLQWNVGKMVDFVRRGADGVVNAVAQNCMVGTISAAVTRRIRAEHDGVPLTTMVFGPTESSSAATALEAFVHQVRRFTAGRREPADREDALVR